MVEVGVESMLGWEEKVGPGVEEHLQGGMLEYRLVGSCMSRRHP